MRISSNKMWINQSYIFISLVSLTYAAPCQTAWFNAQYSLCLVPLLNGTDASRFLQSLLMTVDTEKFMNTCHNYQLMKVCAERCLLICPEQRENHNRRFYIPDKIISVLCGGDVGYRQNLVCLVSQRNGLLSRRCDKIYGLRKLSGGKDSSYYCSLLEDLFLCKDRLFRSACGHAAADASFKLNSIIYDGSIATHQCQLTVKDKGNDAFQYSTPCPPTFPVSLASCSRTFMRAAPSVYSHLPVVINGNASDVEKMCSAQTAYQTCISSIVQACPAGTKYIEDTFHWNVKHELASYMCSEKDAYKRHLECYKTLVKQKIHDQKRSCLETRRETVQLLKNYYLYACNKSSQHDVNYMKRKTDDLITCLTDLTTDHCGTQAASVIRPLLQTKFGLGQFRMRCDGTVLDPTVPAERSDPPVVEVTDVGGSDQLAGSSASNLTFSSTLIILCLALLT